MKVQATRRPAVGVSAASSSRHRASAGPRAEANSTISISLAWAARWRSIAISGTRPEPPATSSTGPPSRADHVKGPPIGPRTSSSSPARTSSTRYGETSPSSMSSTVTASAPAGNRSMCGAIRISSLASLIITPQDTTGVRSPTPRNDSVASRAM